MKRSAPALLCCLALASATAWAQAPRLGCKTDADCTVTTWGCCKCPEQKALSLAELKAEEDLCAVAKCGVPQSCPERPVLKDAVARCTAGVCALAAPPKTLPADAGVECASAQDCTVWCCPQDLAAFKKGKKPSPGCKRCPAPAPAAECLEGRCSVAPRALPK